MPYVPLDFENILTVDVLVDSKAYVSAIAQNDLDTRKQKATDLVLKIDDPPNIQIQVANGQLEKPLATATLKLTGLKTGLHFTRNNSVVIDTTHGLEQFPHLTMQVKTA